MKTHILAVMGYQKAQAHIDRHVGTWQVAAAGVAAAGVAAAGVAAADVCLIGAHPVDSPPAWPRGRGGSLEFQPVAAGFNCYPRAFGPVDGILKTLVALWDTAAAMGAETLTVIEHDCVLLRPWQTPSAEAPFRAVVFDTGTPQAGFRSRRFLHCPWQMHASVLGRLRQHGRRALARGDVEQGFPDRWLAFVADMAGISVVDLHASSEAWSANAIDTPQLLAAACAAARDVRCWAVHGVKQPQVLARLLAEARVAASAAEAASAARLT